MEAMLHKKWRCARQLLLAGADVNYGVSSVIGGDDEDDDEDEARRKLTPLVLAVVGKQTDLAIQLLNRGRGGEYSRGIRVFNGTR